MTLPQGFSDDEVCDAEPVPPKGDIAGDDYKASLMLDLATGRPSGRGPASTR